MNNPSLSTPFPYKDPYSLSQQFDFLCFLRFCLFFVVGLLVFASKDASFLCDLDSSYTVSCVGTGLQVVVPWFFLNYLLYIFLNQKFTLGFRQSLLRQYHSSLRSGPYWVSLRLIHHGSTGARAYVDTGLKIPFVHKIQVEPVRQRFNNSLKRFKIYKNLFWKLGVKSFLALHKQRCNLWSRS